MVSSAPRPVPIPEMPPMFAVRALDAVLRFLGSIRRKLMPGPVALMEYGAIPYMTAHGTIACARLGIADRLARGPATAEELARDLEASPDALARLLAAMANVGLFERDREGRYALNSASRLLARDEVGSMHGVLRMAAEPWHHALWAQLHDVVKTGKPAHDVVFKKPLFAHFEDDPAAGHVFHEAMISYTTQIAAAVCSVIDLSGVTRVVDVGGGYGHAASVFLRKYSNLRATVADLPDVVKRAPELLAACGVGDRADTQGVDFFKSVPQGGDLYTLMSILHDWSDEDALRILRTCRAAMSPRARLLVVDLVLPDDGSPHYGALLDLQMLVMFRSGRERTAREIERLLREAGFSVVRVVGTPLPSSVVEARPV